MSSPQNNSSTSHSLIERAQRADHGAWEKLTRLYSPVVYDWARKSGLQPDDASDVMQNVFQTLTSNLGRFERRNGSDSFRGWLYTITKNKIRDHFRTLQGRERALGGTIAQEMMQEFPDSPPDDSSSDGRAELSGVRREGTRTD